MHISWFVQVPSCGIVSCWRGVMDTGQGQKAEHEHSGIEVARKSVFALSRIMVGKLYPMLNCTYQKQP